MKKFKHLSILLMFCLLAALLPGGASALSDPEIQADYAVLMDAATGEVYFDKNAQSQTAPASTTKLVTALLVVEAIERGDISLYDVVSAYEDCQYNLESDSTNAQPIISVGEEMTVENLLYCAMLVSANEACNILAEYVSGSIDAFVAEMNQRAMELGCTNTHFANANGLEDANHYTTARDMAILAREALNHSLFREICGTLSRTVPSTNYNYARYLGNSNQLLDPDSPNYNEDAYGIKTGYFSNAGYCLVSAVDRNDMDLICVVFHSYYNDETYEYGHYTDTNAIYDWFYDNFSTQTLLSSTTELTQVSVDMGAENSVGVRAESSVTALLPNDVDLSTLEYQIILYSERDGQKVEAPVSAGDRLGEVTVVLDGTACGFSYLLANGTVEMSRLQYLRTAASATFKTPVVSRIARLLIILLALWLVLSIVYRVQRARHRMSVAKARRERAERQMRGDAGRLPPTERNRREPEFRFFDKKDERPAQSRTGGTHAPRADRERSGNGPARSGGASGAKKHSSSRPTSSRGGSRPTGGTSRRPASGTGTERPPRRKEEDDPGI